MSRNQKKLSLFLRKPELVQKVFWEATRDRAWESFWFFLTDILQIPVLYPPLHGPLARWMQEWPKRKKLCLLPRLHLKSTLLTSAWHAWLISQDQNVRILLASHKASDSGKFLGLTKDMILSDRYRQYFPEVKPEGTAGKPTKWNETTIRVSRRNTALKENTVECASEGTVKTGGHYDVLHFDDLVVKESVTTPELILQTQEYHAHCQSLRDPGGMEVVIGTRYDWGDLYGRIIDTLQGEYDIIVRSCLDERGRPIYPTRFTLDKEDYIDFENPLNNKLSLPSLEASQGPYVYYCQYHNNPTDPSNQVFQMDWIDRMFNEYDEVPKGENYTPFRVLDLSSEEVTGTSQNALITGFTNNRCDTFITDIWCGDYGRRDLWDELIRGQQLPPEMRPTIVGVGRSAYERELQTWAAELLRDKGIMIPIWPISDVEAQRPKDQRIRGLIPWIANNKFHVIKNCRGWEQAKQQFLRFPRYTLKDIPDAAAIIPQVVYPGQSPKLSEEQRVLQEREEKAKELFDGWEIGDDLFQVPLNRLGEGHQFEHVSGIRALGGVSAWR